MTGPYAFESNNNPFITGPPPRPGQDIWDDDGIKKAIPNRAAVIAQLVRIGYSEQELRGKTDDQLTLLAYENQGKLKALENTPPPGTPRRPFDPNNPRGIFPGPRG